MTGFNAPQDLLIFIFLLNSIISMVYSFYFAAINVQHIHTQTSVANNILQFPIHSIFLLYLSVGTDIIVFTKTNVNHHPPIYTNQFIITPFYITCSNSPIKTITANNNIQNILSMEFYFLFVFLFLARFNNNPQCHPI